MKKILFLRNVNASWAIRDTRILKEKHDLIDCFVNLRFYLNPSWITNTIKTDILFLWFASFSFYPALILAKLLHKKVILVSGGFDAAYAPAINYGAFTKSPINKWFRRKMFSMADKILCVSKSNMQETIINAQAESNKCEVIYHGFEPSLSLASIKDWSQRKNQIVMISNASLDKFYVKGLDQFLKLSETLPEYEFVLIGRVDKEVQDYLDRYSNKNFRTTGFLPFNSKEFCDILNESKYILQLSYYESFGCSIIDGAIAGCYPIVYDQFALSELIKSEGKTFPYGNIELISNFIKSDIFSDCKKISSTYLEIFHIDSRKKLLLDAIEDSK